MFIISTLDICIDHSLSYFITFVCSKVFFDWFGFYKTNTLVCIAIPIKFYSLITFCWISLSISLFNFILFMFFKFDYLWLNIKNLYTDISKLFQIAVVMKCTDKNVVYTCDWSGAKNKNVVINITNQKEKFLTIQKLKLKLWKLTSDIEVRQGVQEC